MLVASATAALSAKTTGFVRLYASPHKIHEANHPTEALSKVKKSEDDDDGEISEPEDPLMLARDAKDWKVRIK
jgi:hypothetical protein